VIRALLCAILPAQIFTFVPACAIAAHETQEQRARSGALQVARALKELDAETLVKLTLPDLRWAAGGDVKMLETLNRKFAEGKKGGVVIDSVTLGQQTPTGDDGSTRYIFFPYTVVGHVPKGKLIQTAFYMALSDDAGTTWHFVDGAQLDEATIKKAFVRGYDGNPPLPKRERRVVTK
jgi:hypothetical protein